MRTRWRAGTARLWRVRLLDQGGEVPDPTSGEGSERAGDDVRGRGNFEPETGEGLTVVFTDTSTGNVDVYRWNFGDGRTSSARNPAHTYSSEGEYAVTLTVSNAISSDSITKLVVVGATTTPPS